MEPNGLHRSAPDSPPQRSEVPTITSFLQAAHAGELAACDECSAAGNVVTPRSKCCPFSPKVFSRSAFGTSCTKHGHGFNWAASNGSAVSMTVLQDPLGTTPEQTGKLCFVCNRKNPSDATAQNAYELWKAGVSLQFEENDELRYMDGNYIANATMHGKKADLQERELARQCCAKVLRKQISLLSPRVIIACGQAAATSLHEIGLLSKPWDVCRKSFGYGAYYEETSGGVKLYCTYHTARSSVNRNAAKRYGSDTKALIRRKLLGPGDWRAAEAVLERYSKNAGMLVLLLHWLDIGAGVRQAHLATAGCG